jgi:hypothetical protein
MLTHKYMFKLFLYQLLVISVLVGGCQNQSEAQWSRPELIVSYLPGDTIFYEFPNVAVSDSGIFIACVKYTWKTAKENIDVVYIQRTNGTWSLPATIAPQFRSRSNPIIRIGKDNALHLVWGEDIKNVGYIDFFTEIYYATNNGNGWSKPLPLYKIDSVSAIQKRWTVSLPRNIAIDDRNDIYVTFRVDSTALNSRSFAGGRLFKRKSGMWSESNFIFPSGSNYIESDGERLYTTYLTGARGIPGIDANSVFISVSSSGGLNWSPMPRDTIQGTLVSRSGVNPAHGPIILTNRQGRVHLLWEQVLDARISEFFTQDVWHSYSDDAGVTWSSPKTISQAIKGKFISRLQAVIDKNGQLHVLTQTSDSLKPPYNINYITWRNGQWQEPALLRRGFCVSPVIAVDKSDKLHIVWRDEVVRPWGLYYMSSTIAASSAPELATDKPQSFQLFQNYPNPFNPSIADERRRIAKNI